MPSRKPLLLVASEVSGTTTVYEIDRRGAKKPTHTKKSKLKSFWSYLQR